MRKAEIIKLITVDGFIEAFWVEVRLCKTQQDAYEKVETIYEKEFGRRRYASFDSFRVVRDRKTAQK